MLLAKEDDTLQDVLDQQETARNYGIKINVDKSKVMRISETAMNHCRKSKTCEC